MGWADTGFGWNFRNTLGFVTDGAHETFIGVAAYPLNVDVDGVTLTFGWEDSVVGNARDRNAGNDRRLAGIAFGAASQRFRIDLPAPGQYLFRMALGDGGDAQLDMDLSIHDNVTEIGRYSPLDVVTQEFWDAQEIKYTNATWPGSNSPITLTFSSTIFRLKVNAAGVGDNTTIAHVYLTQVLGNAPFFTTVGAKRI